MKLIQLQEARHIGGDIKSSDLYRYLEDEMIEHDYDEHEYEISFGVHSFEEENKLIKHVDKVNGQLGFSGSDPGISIADNDYVNPYTGDHLGYISSLIVHKRELFFAPEVLDLVKKYGSSESWGDM